MNTNEAGVLAEPRQDDTPYRRFGLLVLLLTFGVLLGWAALAPLQSAVVASGRIIVASDNKTVQHLDGGLVAQIAVRDGDEVQRGQLLLRLDGVQLDAQLGNVQGQLLETLARLERLAAEREQMAELQFSAPLRARVQGGTDQEVLDTQQRLFNSRRQSQHSELEVLQQRLAQSRKQIDGLQQLVRSYRRRAALLNEDLSGLQTLSSGNLVSKTQLRERQREVSELDGEIAARESEIARLRDVIIETGHQIELRAKEYQKEVNTALQDAQVQRTRLVAEQRSLRDKLSRIDIRAPVSGKIKGLNVVTVGAVIKAAQPIMEIVPLERDFKIAAQISPMDIDVLHPGLEAEVRLSVFDGARRFPSLFADLDDVSADVFVNDATDSAYYKADLLIQSASLQRLEQRHARLVSGMPVEVVIKTGERTVLDYLIKPLKDMTVRAFNEV